MTILAGETITNSAEGVQHPPHREHLHRRLGQIAEVPQSEEAGETGEIQIGESPALQAQTDMLAEFFAKASEELGPAATEDDLWKQVFTDQLNELYDREGSKDKESLAVNLLVGNLLSSYDLPADEAHVNLRDRVWELASNRRGMTVLRAAQANMGICVMTGDEQKPYASVLEHVEPYSGLLLATDESVDLKTVNMPVHELKDASNEEQAWFIGVMWANQNYASMRRNLEFITDRRELVKGMVMVGRCSAEMLQETGLDQIISPREVVDFALDNDKNPNHVFHLSNLSNDDQVHVFERLLAERPEDLKDYFGWTATFSELGTEQLQSLIDSGYIATHKDMRLLSFKNLAPGTLQTLRDQGVDATRIAESLENFPLEEAKQFYHDLADSNHPDLYKIYPYPEQFGFVNRADFIQVAKDTKHFSTIAVYIDRYTDGSDQQLLLDVIEANNAAVVADHIGSMPALDMDWFVDVISEKQELAAMVRALPFTDKIDQQALFDTIMASPNPGLIMGYRVENFDKLDMAVILDRLIQARLFDVIIQKPEIFTGETRETLFQKIAADTDGLVVVAENMWKFQFVDTAWLIDELAEQGRLEAVTRVADRALKNGLSAEKIWTTIKDDPKALLSATTWAESFMAEIGQRTIFDRLIELGAATEITFRLKNFTEPGIHQAFADYCFEKRESHALFYASSFLEVPHQELIERCCREGWYEPLLLGTGSPLFDGLAAEEVPTLEQMMEWGGGPLVLCTPNYYNPTAYPDMNRDALFADMLSRQDPELVKSIMLNSNVTQAPAEVAQYLLTTDYAYLVRRKKDLFDKSIFTPEFIEAYIETGDDGFLDLYEYAGHKIEWVEKIFNALGRDVPANIVLAAREVERETDEPLPESLLELSVKQRGQPGIEQLKNAYTRIRRQLIYGIDDRLELNNFIALTLRNDVAQSIAKQLTRFSVAQWGVNDGNEWNRLWLDHLNTLRTHRPMTEGFVPSDEFTVRTIDAKEFDPTKLDEDAISKFNSLRGSLDLALEIADSPARGRYERIFLEAKELLETESGRLNAVRDNLIEQGKQKAIENVTKQIESIEAVKDMDTKEFLTTFRDNFSQLAAIKVKGLDHIIRAGAFARAIRRSPEARALAEILRGTTASYDNLVALDDFVEHLVNNEVYRSYFSNDEARKAFIGLSDTTALRKQISKVQNGQSSGQTSLQFIPSRGGLLELSGHIGDACWASKYGSIANEFPNITAVSYVRNPGKNTERLVGAGLLIETRDEDTGEDIVVLRGTNPIENYINGVKVEDFMNNLITYVKQIAGGRRVAMVIDGGPGQAATNRPVLHTYLKDVIKPSRAGETPIQLPENTTFNTYILSQSARHPVYYID